MSAKDNMTKATLNQDLEHFWFLMEKALANVYDYFKMGKEVLDHNIDYETFTLSIVYKDMSKASARVLNFDPTEEDFLKALYGKTKGKNKKAELKKSFNPLRQLLKENPMPAQ